MSRALSIATLSWLILASSISFAEESSHSIYSISAPIDGPIIGVTALGSIIPQALNPHLISPSCPCNPNDVNSFDRPTIGNHSTTAATISDITLGVSLLAPPLLDFLALGAGRAIVEDYVVYAEVLSVSGAFVTLSKYTVQRPIPLAYSGDISRNDPNAHVSFYSGHASLTFAALSATAMTLDRRYQTSVWPWFIVAGVGGSVAYTRVAAGRHFPTDVMMGALAGTAQGTLIPFFHARSQKRVMPVSLTADGKAFALNWTHRF